MSLLTERAARLGMTAEAAVRRGFLDDQGRVLPARPLMPAHPKTATKDHAMNNTHMIIPVTPLLAAELAGTASLLKRLDASKKLNDRDHFVVTTDQLERLAVAALGATTTTPMTAKASPNARFALYSNGPLNAHIIATVAYLRDDASELLNSGVFPAFEHGMTDTALGFLKKLEGMIRNEIVKSSERDLASLSSAGIDQLLIAAAGLAKAAAAPAPVDTEDTAG